MIFLSSIFFSRSNKMQPEQKAQKLQFLDWRLKRASGSLYSCKTKPRQAPVLKSQWHLQPSPPPKSIASTDSFPSATVNGFSELIHLEKGVWLRQHWLTGDPTAARAHLHCFPKLNWTELDLFTMFVQLVFFGELFVCLECNIMACSVVQSILE